MAKQLLFRCCFQDGFIGMNKYYAHGSVLSVSEDHSQGLGHAFGKARRFFVFDGDRKFIDFAVLLESKTARNREREVGENVVGGE